MRKLYRKLLKKLKNTIVRIEILKTYIFEIIAIYKKRNLYKNIKWTEEQQKEFDNYWIKNYGKKISNRWHRLYQSINGVFNVKYIPEILYSTNFEYKLNDYYKANVFSDKGFYDIIFRNEIDNNWRLPKTYLVRYGEIIYDSNRNIITKQEAEEIIKTIDECVIKPTTDSSSGEGVKLLKGYKEIKNNFFNNLEYSYSILQEKIIQSVKLSNLNSSSVNTFRIMTYILDSQVYVSLITLRIGCRGSFVDNSHAGNLSIAVKKNGILEKIAYQGIGGTEIHKYKKHPDSNIIFENYKIEEVKNIVKVVKKLHLKFPEIGVISWDITLDNNDIPVIIEANLLGQSAWFQIVTKKSLFAGREEKMLKSLSKR